MPLDFSAFTPVTETFAAPGAGPDAKPYTVTAPASAATTIAFRQNNMEAYRLKGAGDHEGFNRRLLEADVILVHASVRDGDGDQPPLAVVRGWPDGVVQALYDWVVDRSPGLVNRTPETLAAEIGRLEGLRQKLLAREVGDPKVLPTPAAASST